MSKSLSKETKIIVIGLLVAGTTFIITIYFGSNGFFRHVNIFLPEVIQATVAFKNIDGQVKVIGIKGNIEISPTLIARTGASYILTVINQDNNPHRFYIDGLNQGTKILYPSQSDIITIQQSKEGNYKYYDTISNKFEMNVLGIFKVVTVEKY
jgi:hypothetical protein